MLSPNRDDSALWDLRLGQKRFAVDIPIIPLTRERARQVDDSATALELEQFRGGDGSLGWLGGNTRLDVSYFASSLATRVSTLTVKDLKDMNKAIRHAQLHAEVELRIQPVKQVHPLIPTLLTFGDSSLAGEWDSDEEEDTATFNGAIVCAADHKELIEQYGDGPICVNPMSWRAGKASRSVVSTFGAESLVIVKASVMSMRAS